MIRFNEEYYRNLASENGYAFCKDLAEPLPGFTLAEMQNWLCAYNFTEDICLEDTLVVMGVGVNGVPHMGTVSQFLRAIFFQQKGYKVQIILGDLDSYNARSSNTEKINENVEKCYAFIRALGFDVTKGRGIIRSQFDSDYVMKTAFLIAPYVTEQDFCDVEEDLSKYYQEVGVYQGIDFAVKQSILMMFADFIHPGLANGYKNVIVLSGVDEHPYVKKANEIASRWGGDFAIRGLFSSIIGGLCGYPKMSKSLAGSAICLDTPPAVVEKIVMETPDPGYHNDSVVFQLMQGIMFHNEGFLREAEWDFYNNSFWVGDTLTAVS